MTETKFYAHLEEYQLITGIVNLRQNLLSYQNSLFSPFKSDNELAFYDVESILHLN